MNNKIFMRAGNRRGLGPPFRLCKLDPKNNVIGATVLAETMNDGGQHFSRAELLFLSNEKLFHHVTCSNGTSGCLEWVRGCKSDFGKWARTVAPSRFLSNNHRRSSSNI